MGDPNEKKNSEEKIDETLAESFPASDPPSWTLGREKDEPSEKKPNEKARAATAANKKKQR